MSHSELLTTLLTRRGLTDADAIAAFLSPEYETHTHSPFLLHDMPKAVDRILAAIKNEEKIAVYADFDCDGIPAATILADFFAKIGYMNVRTYIPHRDREGYGLHIEAIDTLAREGVTLIITVDVGITACAPVAHAASLGVDVVVTDHHEVMGDLPQAVAVVNPKLGEYPFRDLCGAAVAFKLVQALLAEGKKMMYEQFLTVQDGWEKWLLDMVAVATVADMVPLIGENRVLAYWGLRVLRKSPRAGIVALLTALKLKRSELTEDDIGFSIGPRVNAASRMDDPELAFRLLTTTGAREAETLAAQLEHLNAQRKGVVAGIVKDVRKKVAARFEQDKKIIVLGDVEWKPSLLGLAANSIVEDRGGMVCLWGRDAQGNLKGSCRSDGSVSVANVFAHSGDIFEVCGGHDGAGGFTVSHTKVHTLQEDLNRVMDSLEEIDACETPAQQHDAELLLNHVSWRVYTDISALAPFGIGNAKPLFRVTGVVGSVRAFGKEKNHIEVVIEEAGASVRAFQFFATAESFTYPPTQGERVHLIASLERDTYRGPTAVVLRVVDCLAGE